MGDESVKGGGGGGGPKRGVTSGFKTLDNYFIKKSKLETPPSTSQILSNEENNYAITSISVQSASTIENEQNALASLSDFSSDIGLYIGGERVDIDDSVKAMLLEKHWTPPSDYKFPFCTVTKKGKQTKKYAQRSHLEKFFWLVLSHKDQGLYCKYCALFSVGSGGGVQSNTSLKRLVKEPLKVFDDLLGEKGVLLTHEKNQYHQKAVGAGKDFLKSFYKPELVVANQVSQHRMEKIKENRERLRPIISTIILCGRQNIPLRGHRDDGMESLRTENLVSNKEGNFRALLKFRVEAGDTALQKHLESTKANATYISKTVQNELIDICKEEIQEQILHNVKAAKIFSVIFDETTDISHKEQLSLSFRYFYQGSIREEFIAFCNAYDMIREEDVGGGNRHERRLTGVALAHIIEDLCHKFNINLRWCVGIGTDSCSVMASDTKGAVHELTKKAIYAKRCPCNNHALNNSLARSSKIASCRNASSTMKKVVAFANGSAKRHEVFSQELGGGSLQSICETRWVERHDGHLQFQGDNLIKICNALERISTWDDSKTASDAECLLKSLSSPDFIISSICLNDILGTTLPLSRLLQSPSIDLKRATHAINDVITILKDKRAQAESVFNQLFYEAKEVAAQLDVELKLPRIVSKQIHRQNNQPKQSVEEYFRRGIYIPLLDSVLNDFEDRLSADVLNLFNLNVFLPRSSYNESDILIVKEVANTYHEFTNNATNVVVAEFQLWVAKWKREAVDGNASPDSLPQIIDECDPDLYPNVRIFLQILATLPVSAATAERSFSTLRRLKSWLRANMGEDRLSGLALLNIHRDIMIDINKVIDRFGQTKRRKCDFLI